MDLKLNEIMGFENLHGVKEFGKFAYNIAGRQHNMSFMLDYVLVQKYGFPASAIAGFNKFIANSNDLLYRGFKAHRSALGDYLDPASCKHDGLPDPTFKNFVNMTKFTTVVFSKAGGYTGGGRYDVYGGPEYCAICGEMPWDREHGIGLIINASGIVTHMTSYMGAYEHNV